MLGRIPTSCQVCINFTEQLSVSSRNVCISSNDTIVKRVVELSVRQFTSIFHVHHTFDFELSSKPFGSARYSITSEPSARASDSSIHRARHVHLHCQDFHIPFRTTRHDYIAENLSNSSHTPAVSLESPSIYFSQRRSRKRRLAQLSAPNSRLSPNRNKM
jgi:hypothetical protein